MKKPEGSGAVVLENLPDDFNQDVLTLLVENIGNLSENDFSMELIPELSKAVVIFKNPSGKLFYSYTNIITFVIYIIIFTFSQKNSNIYIINNSSSVVVIIIQLLLLSCSYFSKKKSDSF